MPPFIAVMQVISHHGQLYLSQAQYNALITCLEHWDWSGYQEPEHPFPPLEVEETIG